MSNKIAALSQRPAAAQNAEAERCDEVLGKAFVQKGKAEKKGGGVDITARAHASSG